MSIGEMVSIFAIAMLTAATILGIAVWQWSRNQPRRPDWREQSDRPPGTVRVSELMKSVDLVSEDKDPSRPQG